MPTPSQGPDLENAVPSLWPCLFSNCRHQPHPLPGWRATVGEACMPVSWHVLQRGRPRLCFRHLCSQGGTWGWHRWLVPVLHQSWNAWDSNHTSGKSRPREATSFPYSGTLLSFSVAGCVSRGELCSSLLSLAQEKFIKLIRSMRKGTQGPLGGR